MSEDPQQIEASPASRGTSPPRSADTPEVPGRGDPDARPGEACGVFGVYVPRSDQAANLIYFGLFALQHRGQESAGIATSNGETVTVSRDMGLVAQVFDERTLAGLSGHVGIGHTRYSTTGSSRWENSQPVYRHVGATGLALGHNGNLTNTAALAARYGDQTGTSDRADAGGHRPPRAGQSLRWTRFGASASRHTPGV